MTVAPEFSLDDPKPRPSMRRDILSAYAATAARVASWIIVSAVVYRQLGAVALGLVTLVRATVGILSYTSLGLGPALVRKLAEVSGAAVTAKDTVAEVMEIDRAEPPVLAYAQSPPRANATHDTLTAYSTAKALSFASGLIAIAIALIYARYFNRLHDAGVAADIASALAAGFGLGTAFRLMSEAPSGLLQARDRIALDNILIACTETTWAILTVLFLTTRPGFRPNFGSFADLANVGVAFAIASAGLCAARYIAAWYDIRQLASITRRIDFSVARQLLAFGSLIVIAQVADFLYAPTDCILINKLIGPAAVAWYSPAIQIDAGLLRLVSGLAAVLYPECDATHVAGDAVTLRRYYQRGTFASLGLLTVAALVVWLCSPWLFKLWFGEDMPQTRAILPLVLIHTVLGGSSAVGRSILLGMGKVKPFTVAVLGAGVSNVILSYIFVRHLHLGLNGIIYGTLLVVIARAGIWMPWYVLRQLRGTERTSAQC